MRKAGLVIQTIPASGPKMEPATYHKHTMPVQGKAKPHDNMPSYYVSAFILTWKTWSSGPGQRQRAMPQSFAIRSNGVMEY